MLTTDIIYLSVDIQDLLYVKLWIDLLAHILFTGKTLAFV